MRLRLAQLMHQDVNFLVLDEPTNHLDIESREVLEEALEDFTGTIVAVSHDRYFLNKLFSRTAWLEDGLITTFEGPYNWAREKWQEFQSRKAEEVAKPAVVEKLKVAKVIEEGTVNVEESIIRLEQAIGALEQEAADETDWMNYELILAEVAILQKELESCYERWTSEIE